MAKLAPTAGTGTLCVLRVTEEVRYAMAPTSSNAKTCRGSVVGDAEHLRAAFRRGDATLNLDDGRAVPIRVIAYTEGGDTAWFET